MKSIVYEQRRQQFQAEYQNFSFTVKFLNLELNEKKIWKMKHVSLEKRTV